MSECGMAFTVQDFHDLVRLLGEHPEWRDELRRLVLAEDMLHLPRLVRELGEQTRLLAEAQRRTEERLRELAEAQQRTEDRLEALTARLDALTARVDALAEAQRQTEQRLAELAESTDQGFRVIRAELDDLKERFDRDVGRLKGSDLERTYRERAPSYFGRVLQGLRVLSVEQLDRLVEPALLDGRLTWEERDDLLDADMVARGRLRATGQDAYLVVEVSWGVGAGDVERAHRRAGILRKVTGFALAAVAGLSISPEAGELAERLGVVRVSDGTLEGWTANS
ncbi:MAG: hypothetical protein AB1609_01660 [Bacillota bacterium]